MVKKTMNQFTLFPKKLKTTASCIALALTAPLALAQDSEQQISSGDWGMSVYASQTSIDSTIAAQQGIDDSLWVIGVSADYTKSNWITSLGVEAVLYDDQDEFSQAVEGTGLVNRGDVSTKSSSASGALLFAATGYQWLYGEKQNIALRLQGGYSVLARSERSIANCSDCYSEDIDVDAGLFVRAGVMRSTEHFSFGIHLQQYVGDGLNTGLGITIASAF